MVTVSAFFIVGIAVRTKSIHSSRPNLYLDVGMATGISCPPSGLGSEEAPDACGDFG
jgi:hypothetical protein